MTTGSEMVPTHPQPDRRRQARPVLAGATLLMIAGILFGCLFPGARYSGTEEQPAATAPTPAPKAVPEAAPGAPQPEPATEDPLPPVAEGEPSRLVVHGDRSCRMIALTYDAGSGADGAAAILDTLKKHGLTSTFFLTGRWVERYPELAKRVADEGHEIANHTYSHPDLTKLPDQEVLRQIQEGEAAIRERTGQDPRPLFREPYGAFSEHERKLARQAGYSYSIYWDVDTLDWQFPGVEVLVSRILKAEAGSIVLMHLNVPDTAIASDQAIPQLREKGYELVTVSRLLRCTQE
ncbi:MAG: polysaccharide deacetylase family protein [Bacillota bacterium]